MALEEYVRKRNFSKTPEPAPGSKEPDRTQGRFFIQRHDATRLHYDLRLEIDGTLKSWAVPKAPPMQPLAKHLAMHVEDHPLEYGPFEGNIPAGNYGAGSVMLWDKGTFDLLGTGTAAEQIKRGDLKFRLHGEKLKGDYALVLMKGRGKGNEWLCIKKNDEFADPSWDAEEHAYSVKTGRTQDQIAADLPPVKQAKAAKKAPAKKTAAAKKTRARTAKKKAAKSGPSPDDLPGAVEAPMPTAFAPMLATAVDRPPSGSNWIYEIKWDGIRALCYVEGGHIRMVSRNGNSFDRQFPELSVVPNFLSAESAVMDGEIAVLDEKGRSSFGLIQPRIHQTDANSVAHLARKTPANLFVFDLLYWDGYDLRGVPLIDRKRALAAIVQASDRMTVSEHFETGGDEMLEAARQAGLEGIIAKRADSKYEPRRSNHWLKVKVTGTEDFVICGYTHGERDTFSSLVLGIYDAGELVYTGCVGTGFDDASLRVLRAKLEKLETKTMPFAKKPDIPRRVTWVRPELVCECKYSEWTRDGRLRAPVFLGLRVDKKPEECVRGNVSVARAAEPEQEPSPAKERSDQPLIPESAKELAVRIDGQPIKFTNVGKIYYPQDGYTKRDVINYYDAVSEYILPHLAGRPLSLKRYPNGIHQEFFFQKNTPETYPDWLRTESIPSDHRGSSIRFVVARDRATLLYLTQLGCIDQNPWMSRVGSLDFPDYILVDLDPQECSFEKIIEATRLVKGVLDDIGLKGYPKTTGGDGMHVFIPVEPRYTYEQVRSFAEIIATIVINRDPELFTTPRAVAKRRKGRVYFDYLQIGYGKTIAGPYVLRAYDGAPVATPLSWDEVKTGLTPKQFHLGNSVARFRELGDLFEPVLKQKQKLEPALQQMKRILE